MEGAFAPLAFLWLVIGHFMQQKEISANTKAMYLQEKSARRQELNSRRDSYFKLSNLVQDQLGVITGFHHISVEGPSGTDNVTMEAFAELRSQSSAGDPSLFIRKMLGLVVDNSDDIEDVKTILFGTEIRARHARNYQQTFKRLLDAAVEVDADNMVSDALLYGSSAGIYCSVLLRAQEDTGAVQFGDIITHQQT